MPFGLVELLILLLVVCLPLAAVIAVIVIIRANRANRIDQTGGVVNPGQKPCVNCGNSMDQEAKFCAKCGTATQVGVS